jgi:serine protease inhibitor
MKLISTLAGVALCRFGKNKESTNSNVERLGGSDPVIDIYDCDYNDEFDPVVQVFSRVTNVLGPKVITNMFLENGDNDNVIISPVSMASQLTLLHEGADGKTREELESLTLMPEHGALQAMSQLKDRYDCITKGTIESKTAMFLDRSFIPKPEFVNRVQSTDAKIFKLNFAEEPDLSRTIIDTWAAGKSGILDSELPEDSVSSETSMMLLSSIKFNAKWAVRFDKFHPGGFLFPDGKTKVVDMMEVESTMPYLISCNDRQTSNCISDQLVPSLINIPLEDPRLQITLLLSNEKFPVAQILAMSSQWLPYWRHLSESNFGNVILRVPKINLTTQYDLTNALFGTGISHAFDPFTADFSRITDDLGLSVSNIFQRNYLKWDLDGASAGGDSDISLKNGLSARGYNLMGDESMIPEFNVDRPFVFVISDRTTDSNLFMGVINDPRI